MIDFNDPELIKKYGSWLKVQVAFYDYLFWTATQMDSKSFNDMMEFARFANDDEAYETSIRMIAIKFPTQEQAWESFKKESFTPSSLL